MLGNSRLTENQENVIQLSKRSRKYIAWTDEETGEITGFSHPVMRSKSDLGKGWVAMYQQAMEWLAEQKLPQEQYRVLLHLMARLDFENYLRVTQKEIAEKLDMHQPSVAKAIKGLLEKDIIRNGPKVGNARTYRLNPRMAHKGSNIKSTIIAFEELKAQKGCCECEKQ